MNWRKISLDHIFFGMMITITTSLAIPFCQIKHAAELGCHTGLISFLERVPGMTETDNSFMGKIMASHPAP
jgi:hypothetical protein